MSIHARWMRSASLAVLIACCIALGGVGQGQAREFEIDGIADCGLRSDRRCSIESVLALWTDDINGSLERVEIDVAWVRQDLGQLDQDERVCLLLEDRYAARLKAVGVTRNCKFDGSVNPGLSTGSRQVLEQPKREDDDDNEKQAVLALTPTTTATGTPGTPGTVTGIVTNALTGQPLAGATVRVDGSNASATSQSNGRFVLTNAPSGARTLRTSANGFVTETRTVTIVAGGSTEQTIALTPGRPGGQVTIVLTWGSQPADLDAHLSGPDRSGGRFHVYFDNKAAPPSDPYAFLDVDDLVSFGPETVTISRDPTTGLFAPGNYLYWVHNFSMSPEFDVSDARVTINSGGAQLDTFSVPGGAAGLDIWVVAVLTIDPAGNVTITPIQDFEAGFNTSSFNIPAGSPAAPTTK